MVEQFGLAMMPVWIPGDVIGVDFRNDDEGIAGPSGRRWCCRRRWPRQPRQLSERSPPAEERGCVDPLEGILGQQLHRQLLCAERRASCRWNVRRQLQPQLFYRKIPSFKHVQHGAANRSGGPRFPQPRTLFSSHFSRSSKGKNNLLNRKKTGFPGCYARKSRMYIGK